ncbi:MFS transporter [Roseiarcaceae bacterium H3SJ34-1]|uniref:MFS transporter n=1 Tax=Terripilifer ovatus TaxID=3032367 RepID=UPI003AB9BB04|nr:MFS transporter [Roseiarcaceae bacterium H3SJ34-1]
METRQTIHIAPLLDDMKIGRTHIGVFILCFVILFLDGMDFAAILVTAPAILRDWQLEPKVMGTIFGAGNLGLLIGAVVFGKLSDVYGRRIGIIAGVLIYSLPALATAFADSYAHLLALRFLTCIGLGGVLPNVVTLLTEGAPQRVRGSSVLLASIGYALGPAAVGALAAVLIPRSGWSSVFLVVGIAGTLLGILLYFVLPESIRFLALKTPQSEDLRRALRRLAPDLAIGPQTQFILDSDPGRKPVLADLFHGRLAVITPLLWAVFFAETLTFMTLVSWVPILIQRSGVSPAMASLAFAYGAAGGGVAQLLFSRIIDSFGWLTTLTAAIVTILALFGLGMAELTPAMIIGLIAAAMSFATAAHNSLYSLVGPFYPTAIRGNGIGLASGAGRIAAIIGPVVGGLLVSQLSLSGMGIAMALPYIATAVLCLIFYVLRTRPTPGVSERAAA